MHGTIISTSLSLLQLLQASQHWILAQGNRSWPPLTSFTFCISSHGTHVCPPNISHSQVKLFQWNTNDGTYKNKGKLYKPQSRIIVSQLWRQPCWNSEQEVAVLTLFGNYSPVIARSLSSLYALSISEEPRENYLQSTNGFCFI